MATKKLAKRRVRSSSRLLPEIGMILSSGMDFFGSLSHMEPAQRDRWGKIQTNLWVFIDGYHARTPFDPVSWLPDGRIDFLRAQWAQHKDEVMRAHLEENRDGSRPWGFWMWDRPEPYPPFLPTGGRAEEHLAARKRQRVEALAVLFRYNLLSLEEQKMINERDASVAKLSEEA